MLGMIVVFIKFVAADVNGGRVGKYWFRCTGQDRFVCLRFGLGTKVSHTIWGLVCPVQLPNRMSIEMEAAASITVAIYTGHS